MRLFRTCALAAAMAVAVATPAAAATLLSVTGPTGPISTPGSFSYNFNAGAGAGTLAFVLDGYRTIDGNNGFSDVFTLSLNGTDIYSATFDIAGGGDDVVYLAPVGATQLVTNFGFAAGGAVDIATPLTLINGVNTLAFTYTGDSQGFDDEAWGLSNVVVTGPSAVPEPAAWAMLVIGFGIAGAQMRRRAAIAA